MEQLYYSIVQAWQGETSIKKSRFICHLCPVESVDAAQEFIAQIRKQYRDATHNVWAYRVGFPVPVERFSDDGEPAGTAGMPTLEVLRKQGLTNCAVVVTRYYGGILLGAGGLVRTYTDSVVQGVSQAGIAKYNLYRQFELALPYASLGSVLKIAEALGAKVEQPEFGAEVHVKGWLLPEYMNTFSQQVLELSQGTLVVNWGGTRHFTSAG